MRPKYMIRKDNNDRHIKQEADSADQSGEHGF
jgi:hypothetical protein